MRRAVGDDFLYFQHVEIMGKWDLIQAQFKETVFRETERQVAAQPLFNLFGFARSSL